MWIYDDYRDNGFPVWVLVLLIAVAGWAVVEGVLWVFKHITIGWVW